MTTYLANSPEYMFSLSHLPFTSFITMKVQGLMEGTDFRKNTLEMFEQLKKFNLNKVLVDCYEMKYISYNDCTWLEEEFLPYATSNGFQAVSFIKPNEPHARLCIENVMLSEAGNKMKAAWFEKPAEAKEWIEQLSF